jgi:hypothetical protein
MAPAAVVIAGRPYPAIQLEPSPPDVRAVVLTGRATYVP